jgi:hypothetical protein
VRSIKTALTTANIGEAPASDSPKAEEEDVNPQPDLLAEQLNKIVALRAKVELEAPAETGTAVVDAPKAHSYMERYYYDVQQAFSLACAGGLASALAQVPVEESADPEAEIPTIPNEIGRSLFFALDITTWEEDENVVLELGWAATWFQEPVSADPGKEVKVESGKEAGTERMSEHGHIM